MPPSSGRAPSRELLRRPAEMDPPVPAMPLDPGVWLAIAGTHTSIPRVGDRVCYFPQGHAEQTISLPDLTSISNFRSFYTASVTAISYLADPITDEVFVRFTLDPGGGGSGGQGSDDAATATAAASNKETLGFAKVLTPSDANSGGGFSLPKYCATSIFPPLDYNSNPPAQSIHITDVHGTVWKFRHIFRGTPKRHLLTSNWAKFANSKFLVAGDSVVFVRDHAKKFFIGLRRTGRFCIQDLNARAKDEADQVVVNRAGFSRNVPGRVPAEEVVEAMKLAEMGKPFEVSYYPKAAYPQYVLEAGVVQSAMRVFWAPGVRVSMSMETEDSSRLTSFQGTIASVGSQDSGPWLCSPWRMIQVTWDEPEVLRGIKNVNPWQLQAVPAITYRESTFYHSIKKPKIYQNPEFGDGEGNSIFPKFGLNASMIESFTTLNPSLFSDNVSPAGMQGARHDQIYSAISNYIPENIHHDMYGSSMHNELPSVSTELTIWNSSQSGSFSSLSQGSSHNRGLDPLGSGDGKLDEKGTGVSFQLFGVIIHTEIPDNAYTSTESEGKEVAVQMSHELDLPYQTEMMTTLGQYHKVQPIGPSSL